MCVANAWRKHTGNLASSRQKRRQGSVRTLEPRVRGDKAKGKGLSEVRNGEEKSTTEYSSGSDTHSGELSFRKLSYFGGRGSTIRRAGARQTFPIILY